MDSKFNDKMEKQDLEYLLDTLKYGLEQCVDINNNTENHYNKFANAIDLVQAKLNLLAIQSVSSSLPFVALGCDNLGKTTALELANEKEREITIINTTEEIEDLKDEWVRVINNYEAYPDKKEWSKKLKYLDNKIRQKGQSKYHK